MNWFKGVFKNKSDTTSAPSVGEELQPKKEVLDFRTLPIPSPKNTFKIADHEKPKFDADYSHLNLAQRKHSSMVLDISFIQWLKTNKDQEIKTGDIFNEKAKIYNLEEDLKIAGETGSYKHFPFDDTLSAELRARVLKDLKEEDTEETLLNKFLQLLPTFSTKEDLEIIKKVIEVAQTNLSKRQYTFPYSLVGNVPEGEIRSDGLDLLALKELVGIMEGNQVKPLNLATGFFSKLTEFLSELPEGKVKYKDHSDKEQSVNTFGGFVLKVKSGKLQTIKVIKIFPAGKVGDKTVNSLTRYSPLMASYGLFFTECFTQKIYQDENNTNNFNKVLVDIDQAIQKPSLDFFKDETSFYVVVDGCVAGPSDFTHYGHESLVANNTRIFAGEIFLFKATENQPQGLRIGFTPRDYNQLHPNLRHGSVVFGDQDMSYHSVPWCRTDYAEDVLNDYKSWWAELVNQGNPQGDAYSPAMVVSYLHYLNDINNSEVCKTVGLMKEENKPLMELVCHSIAEETEFTKKWWIKNSHLFHMVYTGDIRKLTEEFFYNPIQNLNKVWNYKTYLQNELGAELIKQPSLVQELCRQFLEDKQMKDITFYFDSRLGKSDQSKAFQENLKKSRRVS